MNSPRLLLVSDSNQRVASGQEVIHRTLEAIRPGNGNYLSFPQTEYFMTIKLTTEDFKKSVFDYTANEQWKYEGTLPAIIDFYADWCGPCKMVAPVLEELSRQYEGKLIIYKVDTEAEQELAAVFGIRSIPTFLFIPMEGAPMLQPGAFPKSVFEQVIEEHLVVGEKQSK